MPTSYGTEALPPSSGDTAGHARHADPSDAAMGTATRLRDRPDDPHRIGRIAEDRDRLALPRLAPSRKAGLGEERLEDDRGQPAREVLPADAEGQEAAA